MKRVILLAVVQTVVLFFIVGALGYVFKGDFFYNNLAVFFAPLTEELIFRGMLARYLFPKQDNSKQTLIFLLISSIIFALIHFPGDVQQFLVYTSLGFSLGLAYVSRKGLLYSISLHALNNLVSFLMILML